MYNLNNENIPTGYSYQARSQEFHLKGGEGGDILLTYYNLFLMNFRKFKLRATEN